MTARRLLRALPFALALAGSLATAASGTADVMGPDDSLQQAFGPLQSGSWYSGAFANAGDVDYLAIAVPQANTTVHVDVENTVANCISPDLTGCPVWGTLLDGQGLQLGGEGSAAGTGEVDAAASDVIDWTILAPGTYYLAMDSAGDLPTYRVREIATEPQESAPGGQSGSGPAGGTTTGRRPSAGRAVGLNLRRHQRGDAVKVRLVVRHAVRLITLSLKTATGRVLASRHMTSQPAGSHTVALQLDAAGRRALRRAGRLKLTVRMLVVPATGGRIITERSVTLDRPASR